MPNLERDGTNIMTQEEANSVLNGTQGEGNPIIPEIAKVPAIDYEVKFKESSKEALRLLEQDKEKDAEIERLRIENEQLSRGNGSNSFGPTQIILFQDLKT